MNASWNIVLIYDKMSLNVVLVDNILKDNMMLYTGTANPFL